MLQIGFFGLLWRSIGLVASGPNQRGKVMLPKYAFFRDRIVPYADAKVGVLTHSLNYGTGCFAGLRGLLEQQPGGTLRLPPAGPLQAVSGIGRLAADEPALPPGRPGDPSV